MNGKMDTSLHQTVKRGESVSAAELLACHAARLVELEFRFGFPKLR